MTIDVGRFVELALACVHREYPTQVALAMRSDADLRPARELTPAFYGCYDWHSAVHGHWVLARAVEMEPGAAWSSRARAALGQTITKANVAGELAFIEPRAMFERPYGLAWLLALHGVLAASEDGAFRAHAETLSPLAELARGRFAEFLPKLARPVRTGVHSQTAFAVGLVLDWAEATGEADLAELARDRSIDWFRGDRDYALHLEPSGEDFLSPSLGAADLLARILPAVELARWLDRTMPALGRGDPAALEPVSPSDPRDGRLAHLDGLSLSRAWMLERVAAALPKDDERRESLRRMADAHAARGLAALDPDRYEGSHWLGTFALFYASVVRLVRAAN